MGFLDKMITPTVSVVELPQAEVDADSENALLRQPAEKSQTSHRLTEMPSQDTMASDPLTSAADAEKFRGAQNVETVPRNSNISEPEVAHINRHDTDLEAAIHHSGSREPLDGQSYRETHVWPGQKYWKKKAQEAKIQRSCTCLSRLSKRNRLMVKILIGVLIVGIAVAIGFGVSKPLGAWKSSRR